MTIDLSRLQIQVWAISRLLRSPRNARTHSPEQVAQVAASIREFGWTNPILADGEDVIIAGHARLAAAMLLRMSEVPVIVLDHLTDAQKRALILADNRIALNAGWDADLLKGELEALSADGFDLEVLGFSQDELEDMLGDPVADSFAALSPEDVIPEPEPDIVTQPGDVWLLGQHRLLCGDATKREDVETLLAGGLADMVFTDPPYNVDYEGKTRKKLKIGNDALQGGFHEFLFTVSSNVLPVTKGALYICMSSGELHTLHSAFTEAGGYWSTFIIWAKHHFTLGRSDYQRQYEPMLYGWAKGQDHFWCGDRDQGDIWFIKRPAASTQHPTVKPVELVERALRNSSKTRDTVLDPFGGSGTTLIACQKTGRQARLLELSPGYCDLIVRRWQAFTGLEAQLESDQRSFREVALQRIVAAAS